MATVSWTHEPAGGQERLDVVVAARSGGLSRATAQRLIREGAVRVDGRPVSRSSFALSGGQLVEVTLPDAALSATPAVHGQVNLIYEDEHIAVVDKPAGMAVHPGSGHLADTLVNFMLSKFPAMGSVGERDRPGVVHRLDKDTSGLLVFALTSSAYDSLVEALKRRDVSRSYVALVHGHPDLREGIVDAPIGRDPGNRTRQTVVEGGKSARTRYRVVREVGPWSLLELELESGRMHQIRVHLAAIGYPVAGDPTYGHAPRLPGLERQFLHAARLSFTHPESGDLLEFESALPHDLQAILDELDRSE